MVQWCCACNVFFCYELVIEQTYRTAIERDNDGTDARMLLHFGVLAASTVAGRIAESWISAAIVSQSQLCVLLLPVYNITTSLHCLHT